MESWTPERIDAHIVGLREEINYLIAYRKAQIRRDPNLSDLQKQCEQASVTILARANECRW